MAQSPKKATQKPEETAAPKKSGKMFIIIAAVAVLIAAAGGGWYFTQAKNAAPHAEEAKVAPPKNPIFVPLENFTVNLQRESVDQYLQLGLTLKIFELENEAKIKLNLPDIRSKILQLLTTKTASELLTAEGKNILIQEIMLLSNKSIGIVNAPALSGQSKDITAASQVAETAAPTEEHGADAAEHKAAVKTPAEKKGIVDVLFTSFIIQ